MLLSVYTHSFSSIKTNGTSSSSMGLSCRAFFSNRRICFSNFLRRRSSRALITCGSIRFFFLSGSAHSIGVALNRRAGTVDTEREVIQFSVNLENFDGNQRNNNTHTIKTNLCKYLAKDISEVMISVLFSDTVLISILFALIKTQRGLKFEKRTTDSGQND